MVSISIDSEFHLKISFIFEHLRALSNILRVVLYLIRYKIQVFISFVHSSSVRLC